MCPLSFEFTGAKVQYFYKNTSSGIILSWRFVELLNRGTVGIADRLNE